MPKFRKKPVVIVAHQLTAENADEVAAWCDGRVWGRKAADGLFIPIRTLEGEMAARLGDYVIKGIQGEFYPCKPDIFEASYEPVEDDVPPGFEYLDIRIPVPIGRRWTHNTVAGLRLDAAAAFDRAVSERWRTER